MIVEIKLPELGEGIDGAEITEVCVSTGDAVTTDDVILILESDKASMEIPSEHSGEISELFVAVGDEVKTGQLLAKIEIEKVAVDKESKNTRAEDVDLVSKSEPGSKPESKSIGLKVDGSVFASPGVRRLARELEIDLRIVNPTGSKGRITKDDLHGYIKFKMHVAIGKTHASKKEIDFSQWGDIDVQKLTKINKITGERLQQAWQEIPHVTQYDAGDITELNKFRQKLKTLGTEQGIKVTFLPFLMKAAVIVLKEMPKFNSSLNLSGDNLVLKNYYNIGVAVDTPHGLMVPSIKNVDKKTIFDLSKELMDISDRAKNKQLTPEDLKGSTFTISSLGGIGGTYFSPIVNPPEVAILGVSKSEWKPIYHKEKNEFTPCYILPFSLSYDHRVIDGASAAAFTHRLSQVLNDPELFKD